MVSSPISQIQGQSSNPIASTQLGSDIVNREDFLKLLIAQLQNQDPLNPMENQEFVSELATFSSLEQQTNQTKLLEKLVEEQDSSSISQALDMIGRKVSLAESSFNFTPGDEIDFDFVSEHSGPVQVQVSTDSGQVVFTENMDLPGPGKYTYTFDGENQQGLSLPPGVYNLRIGGATDSEGNQSELPVYMQGGVEGVTFYEGSPVLIVNGQPMPLSSVESIYDMK